MKEKELVEIEEIYSYLAKDIIYKNLNVEV